MHIAAPQQPAYDLADKQIQDVIDIFVETLSQGRNWKVRKKTFADIVMGLAENFISEPLKHGSRDTAFSTVDAFVEFIPLMVGSVLERLNEREIRCVEQAAFYALSVHPEHQMAAWSWIESDYRRERVFRKFLRAERWYAALVHLADLVPNLELDDKSARPTRVAG